MLETAETLREARAVPAPAPFVLLDDSLNPDGRSYLFESPVEVVACDRPEQVEDALAAVAGAPARGLHAAGFLSYEVGYLLEPRLAPLLPEARTQPLLWMGLFGPPRALSRPEVRELLAGPGDGFRLDRLRLSLPREEYLARAARVKDYIAAGDVYQINLTFNYLFDFAGDPLALYGELRRKQRVAHGALVRTPDLDILSLSPELFVTAREGRLLTRPMKGTAARGRTPAEDAALRAWLREDPKSRAENLMIVDLLRNDLGRVARIGSVEVPELFAVETYPTVHQMTSTVTGRLRAGAGFREVIAALFPCGSITGAPKVRAMEIIRELEDTPRGVYTGAIGMLAPDGALRFNVAIRTVVLHRDGRGEVGIGSGIVQDSEPVAEFEECLLKARFLTEPFRPFRLIETLRWSRETGHDLLERHLARLAASAAHFGFPCDLSAIREALAEQASGLGAGAFRIRLLLDEDGEVELAATPLPRPAADAVLRYAISERPIDSADPFVYHKTTRRELLEGELERLQALTGCDEVLFLNERGELTEGSRTNLFIEQAGRLLTPPVSCGLLDGTLRRALLEDPNLRVEERVLRPDDLAAAERVLLGNSVRGLLPARPVETPEARRLAREAGG